jgi:hypothetical protein
MKIVVLSLLAILFVICILWVESKRIQKKISETTEIKEMFVEIVENNPSSVTCRDMGKVDSKNQSITIFNNLFHNLNTGMTNLFEVHHLYTQKLI